MKINIIENIISGDEKYIFDTTGIIDDNKLEFDELNTKVKIVLNKDNIILERIDLDKEIKINFSFDDSYGFYYFKEFDLKKELQVFTNEIFFNESEIRIDYDLKMDNVDMGNFKINIKFSNI